MKTIFRKIIIVGVAVLSLVFIASCTTPGEPGLSESASKSEKKTTEASTATTVDKAKPETPAKDKSKPADAPEKEVAATEKTDKAKDAATAVAPSKPAGPKSSIYLGSDGKMAGRGDPNKPTSEAYKMGMQARPAALAGAGLPKDKFGLIDWVAVVDQGEISPIGSLDPSTPEIPPFDMDVVIKAKGDFVKDVLYPHKAHTYWLDCQSCHPTPFIMAKGQNKMSMVEISRGEWCGECHGKVAFPLTDCSRCHTQEKTKSTEAAAK